MSTKNPSGLRHFDHNKLRQPPDLPVQCQFGHNGKQVVVAFSKMINNFTMTPDQCRAQIKGMQDALKAVEEHQAKLGATNG